MKKIFCTLVLTLGMLITPQKEAKASVIIGGEFTLFLGMNEVYVPAAISAGATIFGVFAGINLIKLGKPGLGIILITLDEKAEITNQLDDVSNRLLQQYPFIDNAEVLTDLSRTLVNSYAKEKNEQKIAVVAIEPEQMKKLLAPLDLDPAQEQLMINDFK